LDFPNDAVGETSDVSGTITFGDDGKVQADASTITVELATLQSDSGRRDGYVRNRSLETDAHPLAEFVVRETPGLPWPLPTSGEASFQMIGDMSLHGVTSPLTWDVTAQFSEGAVSGLAKTNFTFGEFEMDIPRVRVVLSVDDDIRLELDFQASVSQ
jgi:polyisoprenoid-binding protein YceI